MDLWGMDWIDGTFVCLTMILFTRLAGGRSRFKSFYPIDVSKELEQYSTVHQRLPEHVDGTDGTLPGSSDQTRP